MHFQVAANTFESYNEVFSFRKTHVFDQHVRQIPEREENNLFYLQRFYLSFYWPEIQKIKFSL